MLNQDQKNHIQEAINNLPNKLIDRFLYEINAVTGEIKYCALGYLMNGAGVLTDNWDKFDITREYYGYSKAEEVGLVDRNNYCADPEHRVQLLREFLENKLKESEVA